MAASSKQIDEALERARRAQTHKLTLHELSRLETKYAREQALFDVNGNCRGCAGKRPVHGAECRLVR